MEANIETELQAIRERQEAIFGAVEKTRKYLLWSFVAQLSLVLVPLLALMIALPFLLSGIAGAYQDLL